MDWFSNWGFTYAILWVYDKFNIYFWMICMFESVDCTHSCILNPEGGGGKQLETFECMFKTDLCLYGQFMCIILSLLFVLIHGNL